MRRSKLTNLGSAVYDETIDGAHIVIKPGETKEFPRSEAVKIRGHYCGEKPVSLKLEHIPEEEKITPTTPRVYVAPDGSEHPTKEALIAHLSKGVKK
jgi:hypothetical protein